MKQFSDAFLSPPSEQLADNTIRAHSKMLECKIVLSCISEFPKFTEFVNSIGGYVSFINCDPTPGIEHFQQLVFFNNQFCIFNRNSKRKVAALTEEAGKTLETLQQVGKGQDAATVVRKLVEGISINAHAGDKLAQYYLGYCCLKGKEVEQDAVKAVEWLQKAAEQKYYEAQYHLAVCYMQGIGVAVDKERALLLMSEAAQQGHPLAQRFLLHQAVSKEEVDLNEVIRSLSYPDNNHQYFSSRKFVKRAVDFLLYDDFGLMLGTYDKAIDFKNLNANFLLNLFQVLFKKITLEYRLKSRKALLDSISPDFNLSDAANTFFESYKSTSCQFSRFDELSVKNKFKEMARIVERACHKAANGDGYLYSCGISHAKLRFKHRSQGIEMPDTSTFKNLAFTLPDRSAAPGDPNQKDIVQLAVYSWIQRIEVSNPLERMLVGDFKRTKLSKEAHSVLEIAFRQDKLEETVRSELEKRNIQSDQLQRKLILFQNLFTPFKSWEIKQSNLFMSELLQQSTRTKRLNKFLKPVRNNRRFQIHYIKQLQHVLNFQAYINKRTAFQSKGAFVTEKLLFFGPGAEVPRNLILGSYIDIIRAEERKKGKIFKEGIELSSDFEYENKNAYLCKNQIASGGGAQQRKQMIVCLVGICDPEKVEMKEAAVNMRGKGWESVYVQVKHENKAVTVFSIREAKLVYPLMIIEYS